MAETIRTLVSGCAGAQSGTASWLQEDDGMIARMLLLVWASLVLAISAEAAEVAGVELPETINRDDGVVLQLNGAGIRSKFFFKIYIAALYLENRSDDAAVILADEGGKRMVMHFLYDEVGREDLVDAWNEGFLANGSEAEVAALQEEIDSFNGMFETVVENDRIILDYLPGQGIRVTIRGQEKGVIAGKPFSELLFAVWLGDSPVTEDLKNELLGH